MPRARLPENLRLPETVIMCPLCEGEGEYEQRYMEGRMNGPCDMCEGAQWLYRETVKPVPESVRNQIAVANDLVRARFPVLGAKTWPLEKAP